MQAQLPEQEHQLQAGRWNRKVRVLLIEDEVVFARAVAKCLQQAGYDCEHATTLESGRELVRRMVPSVVLLDMRLPDGNGLDLLSELVARGISVVAMTAYGEVTDAVHAMKSGATDYLKKPIDLDEMLLTVQKAQQAAQLKHHLDYSRQRNAHAIERVELLGDSEEIKEIRAQIERVAQIAARSDAVPPTVLIQGETGTGKDVAARLLHLSCTNSNRPFVHVDCASLPAELIESELFGHEKGAFTSAHGSRSGLIEAAEDGSLFLDEVGELSLPLQAKLLNVLERRVVRRLGSTKEYSVAAQFIAATNRDLYKMVQEGRFRSDLFYRLNVLTMKMPPLREREDDILLLAQHFVAQTERRYGLEASPFSDATIDMIRFYEWPGNVRELKHQISRAVLLCRGEQITPQDLALPGVEMQAARALLMSEQSELMVTTLETAEKTLIENALRQSNNNVSEAARQLGITRMAMRYRIDRYGIKL
ncbi:DNA-binding transcriptional response regulator, NtrC family, contains REC, AAA-type ATPase, and a Fis-type DNA-binding domains [Methylobacillus rhizosphaerae]|uniref:DNA-binding transcriptional response regulator, NtrC family, contains REC, AAA-type ATPase, and a Fis-type DNA-binding domains n=1 Tax=Methylobacillus rhizosphaerae TaxID=551994 RepID=A0A239AW79_9PROT|nr:sigma-54 dependent transcriptional regulator [Methylobacillus rhizosphaerae]SNR99820.1 DNA-binding transcriptional response regulator, NtrC family, contains REC, AAA-type ATPase, and a Fis-type DNA-binding domains [Methylobacillus rhizosphaerae]